jgi:hypothetical protein
MTSVGIVPETLGGGRRFGSYSVQPSKRPAPSSTRMTWSVKELDVEVFSWDGLLIEDDDDSEAMYF